MVVHNLHLPQIHNAERGDEKETERTASAGERISDAIDRAKERLQDGVERIVGALEELLAPPPQPTRVRNHGRRRPARRDYRFN